MVQQYRMALVTGATSGIGSGFVAALAPPTGLLLTGRDRERLDALENELGGAGRPVETLAADLAEPADRRRVAERAEALGVDLLINNAGFGAFGRFIDNDVDAELGMVAVNVTAVVELTRALLPGMLARAETDGRRAGLIVVASTAAFVPLPLLATYAATKAFELHFAEALADELKASPIDILTLCPGATRTAFFDRANAPPSLLRNAEDPNAVATKALRALGRRRVLISKPEARLAFGPAALRRRVAVAGAGLFMRRLVRNADR